jgi:thermostable 8-oxoguanine DNA glycosylase
MTQKNRRAFHAKTSVVSGDYCIDTLPEACHYLAMSQSKQQFIEETGGFRFGESEADFLARARRIQELNKELLSAATSEQVDSIQEELCRLKGIPY